MVNSLNFDKLNWWDLPDSIKLYINPFPKKIKKLGNFVSVKRLKEERMDEDISRNIKCIKKEMFGKKRFMVNFPINLKNKEYAILYSLMVSEGYFKKEFSLNVPEKEFHDIFKNCIKKLISKDAGDLIKYSYTHGFLRSRAPSIIRHLIPIPPEIPSIIIKNKEFAREYLKVAFEAEGSPIFNKKQHKRYIKISRYVDITSFVEDEKIFPLYERVYYGTLTKKYSRLLKKIKNYPPKILEGEQILLKKYFDIDSKLVLEAIRRNKTDLKYGKITARWVLLIYANNIDKYIREIGFISGIKNKKIKEMKKIKGNNPQYFTLNLIKKILNKEGFFYRKKFVEEMKKLGYKSPPCYLCRYCKKGIIKRVGAGYYKILF